MNDNSESPVGLLQKLRNLRAIWHPPQESVIPCLAPCLEAEAKPDGAVFTVSGCPNFEEGGGEVNPI